MYKNQIIKTFVHYTHNIIILSTIGIRACVSNRKLQNLLPILASTRDKKQLI